MHKVRYEEMLPHEIVEARTAHLVAYLPLGGLEWHGEHLAVGNDALKAHRLCEPAARKGGGLAMPILWYSEPREIGLMDVNHDPGGRIKRKMKFDPKLFTPGTFGKTPEEQLKFYQEVVRHTLTQLRTLGFKAIVILTGHYPIRRWIQPVVRWFNRTHPDCAAYAGIEYHYGPDPTKRQKVGGDHAAKWETSYLMYLRPECVDMTVYLGRSLREKLIGVGGDDPRIAASRELGRRAVEMIVAGMIRKGNQLLKRVSKRRRGGG